MKKIIIFSFISCFLLAQDPINIPIEQNQSSPQTQQEDPLRDLDAPYPQSQSDLDALIQESSPSTPTLPNHQEREEIDLPTSPNNPQEDLEQSNPQNQTPKQSNPLPAPADQNPDPQPSPLEDISQDSQKNPSANAQAPQAIEDEAPQNTQAPQEQNTKEEENLTSDENKMNPKFFDYNKNHQKENLRALTAQEMKEKSNQCEDLQDKKACFEVGMAYYQGRSVHGQNLKQALYFLDHSCDEQNGLGCYEAGIISANNQSYQHSFIFLEKSCQSGDLRGCKNLGILYYNGQGTPKNIYKATEIFKMGCNKGDKLACQKLYLAIGNAYQDSLNYNGAKKNFQQACELGEAQACQKIQVIDMLQKQIFQEQIRQNNRNIKR